MPFSPPSMPMAEDAVAVVVTRPREMAGNLCALLRAAGAEPIEFPVIEIAPLTPPPAPADADFVLFVSRNAVRHGIAHVKHLLTRARVGAVGSGTAAALAAAGIEKPLTPSPDSAAGGAGLLANAALARAAVGGRRVLIVRGEGGNTDLANGLRERGAEVDALAVYRRTTAGVDCAPLARLCEEDRDTVLVVTSSEGVRNLFHIAGPALGEWLRGRRFVAISPRVVAALRAERVAPEPVLARAADDQSLAAAALLAAAA